MIISLLHWSILRRIWLNFIAPSFFFLFLDYFFFVLVGWREPSQFLHVFRISNFFELSITEET
jgi:hypothetical protein